MAGEDPPARVGRVSFVQGQLGFHAQGETQWSAAAVNYPVATGGAFWTDPKSRAEIRIGTQTISLAGNTEIDIARLDEQVMQLALPQGRIGLHVRQLGEGNSVEIDIPRGGVWLLQPGIYDIDSGSTEQPSRIMVFEGSARFVGGTLDVAVKAGDAVVISGTTTLTATTERAAPDDFVRWCRSRDYDKQRLAAPYYISPRMTGYEELDTYGRWRTAGDYGPVWYPNTVPTGWAPYRYGHWVWVGPWGWTWVDNAPWGFAPFHYGRWAFIDGYWGWAPGGFVASPVYAPALVGWLGDPAALVLAAAVGPLVGWFPLGPGEAYWPSFNHNPGFVSTVNAGVVSDPARLVNPTNGNLAFANRSAATVVPQHSFATNGRLASAALPISHAAAKDAQVTAQAPAAHSATAQTGTSAGAGATKTSAAVSAAPGAPHAAAAGSTSRSSAVVAGASGGSGHVAGSLAGHVARAAPAKASHTASARGGAMAHHGGGPHGGGSRGGGGGPHFSGSSGGPHGGGGPHAGGGGKGGGGPHASGGGGKGGSHGKG